MPRFGRTDEAVIRERESPVQLFELRSIVVHVFLHWLSSLFSCLEYFLSMFIGTSTEKDFFARKAPRASEAIRLHKLEGESDMWVRVYVRERRRNVACHS